jgi:hypothetical protein
MECKQLGEDGSPASERGGGGGGNQWRAGESAAPVLLSQREREGEQVRDGGEAEAQTGCREAERVGATDVHAEDGAGMRPPRGVARMRAVGSVACAREGEECGARLGRWSRPSRGGA